MAERSETINVILNAKDRMTRRFNAVSKSSQGLEKRFKALRTTVIGLVGAFATFKGLSGAFGVLKEGDLAAFNMTMSLKAANREFENVGAPREWSATVRTLSDELKIYSDSALKNAVSRTVDMTKRLGMSKAQMVEVIKRSADLGAGKVALTGAVERVTAALRGEAESAEFLGLTLNENYIKSWYKARGATQGAWKDLSDLQKAQIRYNVMLEQTAEFQGRAAKSSGRFFGSLQFVSKELHNAVVNNEAVNTALKGMGAQLRLNAPALGKLISDLVTGAGKALEFAAAIDLERIISRVSAVMGQLGDALKTAVGWWGKLNKMLVTFQAEQKRAAAVRNTWMWELFVPGSVWREKQKNKAREKAAVLASGSGTPGGLWEPGYLGGGGAPGTLGGLWEPGHLSKTGGRKKKQPSLSGALNRQAKALENARKKMLAQEQAWWDKMVTGMNERFAEEGQITEEAAEKELSVARMIEETKLRIREDGAVSLEEKANVELERLKFQQAEEIRLLEEHGAQKSEIWEIEALHKQQLRQRELENEKQFQAARLESEQQYMDSQLGFLEQTAGGMGQIFGNLYEATGGKVKAFFYLQKAAAIAMAYVNTYQAATKALNDTAATTTQRYINATIIIAKGLAYAAAIQFQKLSGGGLVQGWSPHSKADNVPIMATAKEFMQPVSSVEYYGRSVMEGIKRRLYPRELFAQFALPSLPVTRAGYALAGGGPVPAAGPGDGAKGKGQDGTFNYIHIQANDAISFADLCERSPEGIITVITKGMEGNTALRNVFRNTI